MAPTKQSGGYAGRGGSYTIRLSYVGQHPATITVKVFTHEKGDQKEQETTLLERGLGRQPASLWEAVQVLIWAAKQLEGKPYPGAPEE